ncbi:MAG: carboxypeptidase regulatory-like domain-containing protein [Planctomycetota bacterium]|jgi:protocatechuate 3,4-dioxygenase beta subunit
MSRSRPSPALFVGIAVLLLAALGVVWMLGPGAAVDEPDVGPALDGRPGAAPDPVLPDTTGPRPDAPEPPPDLRRLGSVRGRLITPGRRVVPEGHIESYTGTRTGMPGLGMQTPLNRDGEADEDGRFVITELPETGDLLLQLTGETFAVTEAGPFRVVAGTESDLGDLMVDPGMDIVGSVVDSSAKPVPGAAIRFYQMQVNAMFDVGHDIETVSDERGLFRIRNVRVSPFTLRVKAEGYANARVLGQVIPGQAATEWPVKVHLREVSSLTGSVLAKRDREPIEGATVEAVPLDPENDGGRAVTDADGNFEIEGIAAGNYVVTAVADGFAKRSQRTWADAYGAPIQIVLPEQGTLEGVVLGVGGQPVRSFEVQARFHRRRMDPPSPRFGVQRVVSDDGSFVIQNLDGGFWCVQAWAQGYALTDSQCVKVAQGRRVGGLVVELKQGATLEGRAEDHTGAPVPGTRVSLHTNREPDIAFLRDTDPDATLPPAVHTRPDGSFRFTGLADRMYQLEVDHPDYALVRRNDVQAVAGVETEVAPVVLERGASITGIALTPGGQPLTGVTVYLAGFAGSSGGGETTSDGQGRFTFTRLKPGEYHLTCFGRNPSLGTMLSGTIGDNKPTPFTLLRAQNLTMNVVSIE